MTRRNSINHTGHYIGEEISATFTQTFERERSDIHGVPDEWVGRGDIEVTALSIIGAEVTFGTLPDVVHELIIGLATEVEWREE